MKIKIKFVNRIFILIVFNMLDVVLMNCWFVFILIKVCIVCVWYNVKNVKKVYVVY